jgi:phthiodiolone/phenolphthiodiolone dimycocerosates ketoreductase
MLGHLAARNRLGRLRRGVSVTDTGRRNPAVTAQAAATLHLLTRGRAILGIGTGEREGNEPYGVDWSKPVARFEEALATIRALWNSGGELVKRDSPFFPFRDAVFDLPPYRGKWPEIWIAAHGPRMLRATGRYADAWFPAFPTGRRTTRNGWRLFGPPPPTQAGTRCPFCRLWSSWSSPAPAAEPSTRR